LGRQGRWPSTCPQSRVRLSPEDPVLTPVDCLFRREPRAGSTLSGHP
jgi:hypothetical protein